ncbi:hypothetical protein NO932_00045 [Pelagibacterium sp. 26DY04]|uniref:hypothetical protein n=1 Tax=Pelagibacterium sp. 26DY04 TaxID=2967130 RepID=UPI0028156619|nr:hypothetical protein [Pelagibacterium sp. 26DY04]WMT87029.1 hypothetical protein NO932_00045 [Pelagibacterium sp. 26DY04]
MALVLFLAFQLLAGPATVEDQQGQRDCAALRSAVLELVGDLSKDMLFASRDMNRSGWLDANVVHAAFKDVQIAVMHFDYAYEVVPKTRDACRALSFQFGIDVGTYIERVMATGTRPETAMQGLIVQ